MRRLDLQTPWGRPGDGILFRKREQDAHRQHRDRLDRVKSVVDTREPHSCDMRHMQLRAKKKQHSDELQREIANSNSILMEKMLNIIKAPPKTGGGGVAPGFGDSAARVSSFNDPYLQLLSHKPQRRREQERIAAENRVIARRMRDLEPIYDTEKLEQFYAQQAKYLDNISKAKRDDQRAHRALARRASEQSPHAGLSADTYDSVEASMLSRSASAPEAMVFMQLKTARQVRNDVAAQRPSHGSPLGTSQAQSFGGSQASLNSSTGPYDALRRSAAEKKGNYEGRMRI